jgi:hypothetical protein
MDYLARAVMTLNIMVRKHQLRMVLHKASLPKKLIHHSGLQKLIGTLMKTIF